MVRAALILLIAATGASAETFDEAAARSKCQAVWASDFQMQAYCLDQQKSGHAEVEARRPQLDAEMMAALRQCRAEWPSDWTVTAYCLDQNIEGRAKIPALVQGLPEDATSQILTKCRAEWPLSFTVQAYCVEQQATGWRTLNGQ